jgi:uncharacterized protein (DUF427 family)
VEPVVRRVRVIFAGTAVADSARAMRVLETSHPPVYYIPADDVAAGLLLPVAGASYCEWKGTARWFDVVAGGGKAARAAWCYDDPQPAFRAIAGHLAFYAGPMEACFVGEERVRPQPGAIYGGWITSDIVGPFKGEPGTAGW